MDREQVEADFNQLRDDDRVEAVLLFGSHVTGRAHERSDIDICIVAPDTEPIEIMRTVWRNPDLSRDRYDVHTFEEFGLKMKHQVMENHEIIWCRDTYKLQEYFYHYRKLWNDTAKARGVA